MTQPGPHPTKPASIHYGYIILITGVLTVTGAVGMARFGYTMILPSMKQGLALTNSQMGLLATGNFIGYMTFSLAGGMLASRYGPRGIIAISMLLTGTTMGLTGLAGGVGTALLLRILTGLGSGGSNVPMMGLVSAWFASRRRGLAAGLMSGGSGIALVLTGYLLPLVNQSGPDGWRLSWFLLGGAVVLLGIVSLVFIRNSPSEKNLWPVGATGPGHSPGHDQGRPDWRLVYTSRPLWLLGSTYACFGFSYVIFATFFTAYLVQEKGLTQVAAGNLWAILGAVSIISGVAWGSLSDRIGRKYGLAVVFVLQSFCFFFFATAGSYNEFLASALLYGLTAWSIPSIMVAACGDLLGSRLAPAAVGMATLIFGGGQVLGPTIAGILADASHSFSPGFQLAGAVAALGLVCSLLLPIQRKSL